MSFKKLMRKKPLSKITISEIISDCGLNRNTFYTIFLPNRPIVSRLWYNVMGDERWQNHMKYQKASCWK